MRQYDAFEMDAETWGRWHAHVCRDCGKEFACHAAHGDKSQAGHRCDSCLDAYLEGVTE